MLDIIFYSENKEEAKAIAVSEEFYQWLARSDFSRIGKSNALTRVFFDTNVYIIGAADLPIQIATKVGCYNGSGLDLIQAR